MGKKGRKKKRLMRFSVSKKIKKELGFENGEELLAGIWVER